MHSLDLLHPDLPELVDELLQRQGWSWEAVSRGEPKLGGQPVTLDSLQWFLVTADPVLWAETNLINRPEDGGGLWQLFDYQKPSIRFRGHVVHQDGAEVGKTREIVSLVLWGCTAEAKGSVLIGSALDGDLDEIWEEIEFQLAANPFLRTRVAKKTTKPYRRLTLDNGLKAIFRPAGHDGRAYRGIHVRGRLLHDEAAKVTNPRSWAEFWRAAKPGCEIRLYSVPTGDRLCTFQRIADSAIPSDQVVPAESTSKMIVEGVLRNPRIPTGVKALAAELGGRVWVRFHWPKTIMPPPFWSEERRQEYIGLYGGPDEPGYIHNVLGLPGDPEHSTFPSRLLDPAVRFIPDYRSVELRWDAHADRIEVKVRRLNPAYEAPEDDQAPILEDELDENDGLQPLLVVYRDSVDVADYDRWPPERRRELIRDLVACTVRPVEGLLTAGVDVGSSSTTEINFERSASGRETWILRVSVHGFDWNAQRDLIRTLDEILCPAGGWGFDATGVGKVLVDLLQGEGDSLAGRISGFVFNMQTAALNPADGEPLLDPQTNRPITLSYKEQGTQLLEKALADRVKEIPNDPELIFLLQNHTFTETGGVRRYSKVNDHVADSWRVLALRRLMSAYGIQAAPPLAFRASSGRIDAMTFESM
jgi:hypothetical protein